MNPFDWQLILVIKKPCLLDWPTRLLEMKIEYVVQIHLNLVFSCRCPINKSLNEIFVSIAFLVKVIAFFKSQVSLYFYF